MSGRSAVDLGDAPVIHLTAFAAAGQPEADVLIPLSTTFERSGTFCNFEGKRNRFEKVFDKPAFAQHAAGALREAGSMSADLAVHGMFMLFAISFMMGLATVFTWVERKQSAITSDRIGANRCYVRIPFTNIKFVAWGLFHGVADGGKLLLKENFTPRTYDRFCYNLAPWLAAVPVLFVFAVIPFGGCAHGGRAQLRHADCARSMPVSCSCWPFPASACSGPCSRAGRPTTSSRSWVRRAAPRR